MILNNAYNLEATGDELVVSDNHYYAINYYRRAILLFQSIKKISVSRLYYKLGQCYEILNHPDGSEFMYSHALVNNKLDTEDDLELAIKIIKKMIHQYYDQNKWDSAKRLIELLSVTYELGYIDAYRHSETLSLLSTYHERRGELGDAIDCMKQSIDYLTSLTDEEHYTVIDNLHQLSCLYLTAGHLKEALKIREKILSLCKGPGCMNYWKASFYYAETLALTSDIKEAIKHFTTANISYMGLLGPNHPVTSYIELKRTAAFTYVDSSDDYSLALHEQASYLWEKNHSHLYPNDDCSLEYTANYNEKIGDYHEARYFYELIIRLTEDILGNKYPYIKQILLQLEHLYQIIALANMPSTIVDDMLEVQLRLHQFNSNP